MPGFRFIPAYIVKTMDGEVRTHKRQLSAYSMEHRVIIRHICIPLKGISGLPISRFMDVKLRIAIPGTGFRRSLA